MSGAATVRILRPEDAPAYRSVRLAGLAQRPSSFGSSLAEEAGLPLSAFRDRIASPLPDAVFGAFVADEPVGTARFQRERGLLRMHAGAMTGVAVLAAFQGRGIGALLVDAVVVHARTCVHVLRAAVETSNAGARRLYLRAGFQSFGTEPKALLVDGRFYDEDLLSLDLGAPAAP